MVHIGNSWDDILADEFKKEYYLKLREFLKYEYSHFTVYPDMHDIFNSLKYTPYENVKAVIIGQDPYHGPGQAHGLCFPLKLVLIHHRLCRIFLKNLMLILVSLSLIMVSLPIGLSRVC